MALFVHGQDVRARGFVKPGLGFPLAALLELAQCGRVFLALTAQTAFLNADIVELALIEQEDLGFDQMLAFTEDLEELREWLRKLKVKQIAMESTGVYWIPVWNVLERSKKKFELVLVNPQHVRALPGRKTYQQDCERIAELMQYGLLRGSFIPPRPIRELRELTRRRVHQQSDRNRVINRIGRLLETANLKLESVASNIVGKTGRLILKEIIDGVTNPERLAELAQASFSKGKQS